MDLFVIHIMQILVSNVFIIVCNYIVNINNMACDYAMYIFLPHVHVNYEVFHLYLATYVL